MKKSSLAKIIAGTLLLVLAVVLALTVSGGDAENGRYYATVVAMLPPVIAIVLALITKEVYSSLFIGILAGALFANGFKPVESLNAIINDGLISAVEGNAGIFLFLIMLGILVALVNSTGAAAAFGRWAASHIKTRVGSALAAFALGVLIFVDDYFNCLTVGSVMSPVTDRYKMSRAKLAYIIDATAAPICMIAPISSWAAAVTGVAADLNVDGIQLFINAIPYNFYSIFTIVFVIALNVMGFDYGSMAAAELKALRENDLGIKEGTMTTTEQTKATLWDMLLPIIVLIVMCIIGMVYVGGFWDAESEAFHNLIFAFGNTDAFVALPWGSLIALLFSIVYLMARRVISFKGAMDCIVKGFNAMVPALLILTFAVTLKSMTGLLGADMFVKGLMEGAAKGLFALLPAVIFVVACFMAFATGTSWGTFGILIPIVLPIFENDPQLLIIGISACLAGAVCGDHCSPISDTTIMASAGAGCDHVQHVSTQIPYAVTVAAIAFVSYILAGFVHAWYILLPFGAILTVATLLVIRAVAGKKTV